eukprot:60811-Chlamydomonas_euryale.AAC.8
MHSSASAHPSSATSRCAPATHRPKLYEACWQHSAPPFHGTHGSTLCAPAHDVLHGMTTLRH